MKSFKRILLIAIPFGILSLLIINCNKESSVLEIEKVNPTKSVEKIDNEKFKPLKSIKNANEQRIKILGIYWVLRHAGTNDPPCVCEGCECPGCKCPLGICACRGISYWDGSELEADEGSGDANIENEEIFHIIFDQPTAHNGVIEIDEDFFVDDELADSFGVTSIKILADTVDVNFSRYPYGAVSLACVVAD